MIHFACKNCGRPLAQPDAAAGTLVFCACGQGNRVPSAGTPPPPEVPLAQLVPTEPEPNPFAELTRPPRPAPAVERDPQRCFNHPDAPTEETCDACGEGFCAACVVTLQERVLCGPCKNFRLRLLQRPSYVSGLSIASLLITFVMGAFGHCLLGMGLGTRQPGLAFFGVVPQLVALVLGAMAVYRVETQPRTTGRALAMTGLLTAFVLCVELILLAILFQRQAA